MLLPQQSRHDLEVLLRDRQWNTPTTVLGILTKDGVPRVLPEGDFDSNLLRVPTK